MIDEKKLEKIKEKIVNAVSPEKIILFGSYARGKATGESDIDQGHPHQLFFPL